MANVRKATLHIKCCKSATYKMRDSVMMIIRHHCWPKRNGVRSVVPNLTFEYER